jgi:hypothetical protein
MIIAMGFALFGLAVNYLPIFGEEEHAVQSRLPRNEVEAERALASPVLHHAGD